MDRLSELLGYPPEALALISLCIVLGGIAKGIAGVGLPIVTLSIILTAGLMEPRDALAALVLPILVTNLWQAVRAGDLMTPLKRHYPMIITLLIFLYVGSLLLAALDTQILFAVLGACLAAFSAMSLWKPRLEPLKPETERWAGPLAGTIGGLLGGISTVWGPPMSIYLVMLHLKKDEWVRTVGLIWFSGTIPLTAFYWANGVLHPGNIWITAAACVPVMVGILIGEQVRKFIDEDLFRKILLIVLFLSGLNLIRRAIF